MILVIFFIVILVIISGGEWSNFFEFIGLLIAAGVVFLAVGGLIENIKVRKFLNKHPEIRDAPPDD